MTDRRPSDERLREAFQALGETARAECSEQELERIWQAVSGELPAVERRELVDRLSTDAATAEAWRGAWALSQSPREGAPASDAPRARFWTSSWLAAAAVLVISLGGLLFQLNRRPADDTFREPDRQVVGSLVPTGATLPRDAFRLRWTPAPEGSRYQVTVTTEDLQVLTTAPEVTVAEFLVHEDLLSSVGSGERLLWR
ncbi:MAG: hypothetical protein ACRD2X_00270, partial [Vicinamibacteraceae bacterium]